MAVRIQVPLVVDMTDEQVTQYAAANGLPKNGGRLYTREIVEDVQKLVLTLVQQTESLGDGADVSLKGR